MAATTARLTPALALICCGCIGGSVSEVIPPPSGKPGEKVVRPAPPAPPVGPKTGAGADPVEVVRKHVLATAVEPKTLRFVHWGPHDLDGKLFAAVKRWKEATARKLPAPRTVAGNVELTPDMKLVTVRINDLRKDGSGRFEVTRVYCVRGGKVIDPPLTRDFSGIPLAPSGPLAGPSAPPFLLVLPAIDSSPGGWLEADLSLLREPLD